MSATAATPYLTIAEPELAACGLTPRGRRHPDHHALTPQELAVADLVADGLSNRDVASRLFVSTKTVEFHLNNIYRKLGIRSRVQLANHLAERTSRAGQQ